LQIYSGVLSQLPEWYSTEINLAPFNIELFDV